MLWTISGITLVTNEHAASEAWDCLSQQSDPDSCRAVLSELLNSLELVASPAGEPPPSTAWRLRDPKDVPILFGAIEAKCHYLLTADKTHFGPFFGQTLDGVTILQTGVLLERLGIRLPGKAIE
jgi:hypothetical protein